jgi:hypothetical protein
MGVIAVESLLDDISYLSLVLIALLFQLKPLNG